MILEEERPRSELMFSVPKAILFCPRAAVHVGQDSHGCHGASSRDGRCFFTGNLISELSEKNSLCFIKLTLNTAPGFSFPRAEWENKYLFFLFRKSSSLHCLWPSQFPALLPFTEFCFSAFTLVVTRGTSLAGVTQLLHQALSGEAKQNRNDLSAEVPTTQQLFSISETRESTQISEL